MATTAYQEQGKRRTRKALALRATADKRARRLALRLIVALTDADTAKRRLERVNVLYGTSYAPETMLVEDMRTADLSGKLGIYAGGSLEGAPAQVAALIADGNGGNLLALEALFGEVASGTPPVTPPAPAAFNTTLNGPNGSATGVTLTASVGDSLKYNELTSGGSAPASMDIQVAGRQVANVVYFDRYTGKPFSFTTGGVTRTGTFGPVVNY